MSGIQITNTVVKVRDDFDEMFILNGITYLPRVGEYFTWFLTGGTRDTRLVKSVSHDFENNHHTITIHVREIKE